MQILKMLPSATDRPCFLRYEAFLRFSLLYLCIIRNAFVEGFNLETRLPIVKLEQRGSYFGYSVATHIIGEVVHPSNQKLILVGAPLGQNYQPQTTRSGALYKCPISDRRDDCEQVITDGRRLPGGAYEPSYDNDRVEELHPPLESEEIKDGQWLGVTVRSQGLGGKVLVCAHRYITKIREAQYGQGLCYVLANNLEYDEAYEPCKGRTVQRQHEDYGYCQVGTSGALLEDNTMVLGTPGPFTWRGTIFVTEIGGDFLQRDKNTYYGDHSETRSPVDKYSYLGMAVTGGRYFGPEMYYAAGAPRSNGHGQVIIFRKGNTNPIPVKKILDGEQFASSFGYELATADVNGDAKPDLLVAAPFYFTKNEGGAVYVYQNENDNIPDRATLKLTGTLESRFGLAVANIGDINKDLCDDIAIGAPYDGNGVVYIYLGNRQGLSKEPSQVITSSDLGHLPTPIQTFGSSLAGGTDLDGNSYPDVVIGAYNSSAVVALLSRPIINIITSVRDSELKNIDPTKQGCPADPTSNLTCFSFEACCAIHPYENTSLKTFRLKYTIEAETFANTRKFSRIFFNRNRKPGNIIMRVIPVKTNGIPACTQETVYIKENTRDIQSPIKFRLNYTIVETQLPANGLSYLNPILDQKEADKIFVGTFQKDCGTDDICESELNLVAELNLTREFDRYSLVLGEIDELKLNITITNYADSAYEAQLFIVHQPSVTYIAASKFNSVLCNRFNETVVVCSLGNPMRRDTFLSISLRFDPNNLDDEETELFFNIFANTTSKLIGDLPRNKINVNIIKRADVLVLGWPTPQQSFYGGEIRGESAMQTLEDIGTSVTHTYQVYNDGPWKAYIVQVNILWPYQVANDKKQGKWLLYLDSFPVIEGIRNGKCVVDSSYVNPLKLLKASNIYFGDNPPDAYTLKSSPIVAAPSPNNSSIESGELTPNSSKSTSTTSSSSSSSSVKMSTSFKESSSSSSSSSASHSSSKKTMEETHLNRVRRDRAKIIRAERFVDKEGKKTDIVNMDCEKGSASCIPITCELYNMPKKAEVLIHIRSRLWNSTLVSDYPRVDMVKIVSTASIRIAHDATMKNVKEVQKVSIETKAYPELWNQVLDTSTPIWVIILAVLGGLLVLALLAALMWKCGFFKRRRPDPTLSGNLEKNSENKPLCQNNDK